MALKDKLVRLEDLDNALGMLIIEPPDEEIGTPVVQMETTDIEVELEANKLYIFPEMSALTITLATPYDATIANEYHFIFTSGVTATTLTIPNTVIEPTGFAVEADTMYEISIMENLMLVNSWAVSSS